MDQFSPATAPTTFGELMEIHDSVSGKLQCRKEHPKYGSHMRLAYGKPASYIGILALITDAIPNLQPIKQLKPLKPVRFYHCIFPPYLLTIQEMDSDEHIVLAPRSSIHYLHNM
jgi:hypothetical protein